jgi:hypothetical protein
MCPAVEGGYVQLHLAIDVYSQSTHPQDMCVQRNRTVVFLVQRALAHPCRTTRHLLQACFPSGKPSSALRLQAARQGKQWQGCLGLFGIIVTPQNQLSRHHANPTSRAFAAFASAWLGLGLRSCRTAHCTLDGSGTRQPQTVVLLSLFMKTPLAAGV